MVFACIPSSFGITAVASIVPISKIVSSFANCAHTSERTIQKMAIKYKTTTTEYDDSITTMGWIAIFTRINQIECIEVLVIIMRY